MADVIHFTDGAGYERYMGVWSRLVGARFLDWLAVAPGLRWLDVGCGNGAFTELLFERCAPSAVDGIDPSEAQLAFARTRERTRSATYTQGDAIALPYPESTFDVAVMPLVIFFVPDPGRGVREMARVVRPGGRVTAYGWDLLHGGLPYDALHTEMRALGVDVPMPPRPDASQPEVMEGLWRDAGLTRIETRQIVVERSFDSFEDYWTTVFLGPSAGARLKAMEPATLAVLKARMQARLPVAADGQVTYSATANAIQGVR